MQGGLPVVISCWSVKGGVGTTVVSVALALTMARRDPSGGWLVDLDGPPGDAAGVLGIGDGGPDGVTEWLAAGLRATPQALARLAVPVADGLSLIGPGRSAGEVPVARAQLLAAALADRPTPVVVDCGRIDPGAFQRANGADQLDGAAVRALLAASASTSLLVMRPCYLALRRAVETPVRPSGVIVIHEPGRSLGPAEVEDVLGVEVVACVDVDASIARAVDAGILASRMPRMLAKAMREAA